MNGRNPVLKLFGRNPEFFFKGAVKCRIVLKTIGFIKGCNTGIRQHRIFTDSKPFFKNILVKRNPGIFLEHMGNVIFTDKKMGSNRF